MMCFEPISFGLRVRFFGVRRSHAMWVLLIHVIIMLWQFKKSNCKIHFAFTNFEKAEGFLNAEQFSNKNCSGF